MHKSLLYLALILSFMMLWFSLIGCSQEEQKQASTAETYLGQKVPGSTPVRFAEDILTVDHHPHGRLIISADEAYLVWAAFTSDGPEQTILFSTFDGEKISQPQVAPFAITNDGSPYLTSDGSRIYFTSERSAAENGPAIGVWYVDKTENGWSEPTQLDIDLDPATASMQFSVSKSGNLYFSLRKQGERGPTLCWSKPDNGRYSRPMPLEGEIGDTFINLDPFIAPDETYILFASFGRSDGFGIADIYVSFRQKDGTWGSAKNLGNAVNGEYFERFPSISPDGKYLFFVRSIGDNFPGDDISYYWVDANVMSQLAPVEP